MISSKRIWTALLVVALFSLFAGGVLETARAQQFGNGLGAGFTGGQNPNQSPIPPTPPPNTPTPPNQSPAPGGSNTGFNPNDPFGINNLGSGFTGGQNPNQSFINGGTNTPGAQQTPTAGAKPAGKPGSVSCSLFDHPINCAIFLVSYIPITIGTLFISLGAWIAQFVLNLSNYLVNSDYIQKGFSLVLGFANLGFVLVIIVIALATILRNQTYGIKQILWKLVVAAVMVNFSLVIAGAIINVGNQLTTYEIGVASAKIIGPGSNTGRFINGLAEGFAPQRLLDPSAVDTGVGGDFSQFISLILNVIFIAVFTAIIAFTFMALAILLLIRHIYLSVLLVIMPFVWLLWIFPSTKSNFSKWWNQFLRWVFFPPIVVFFLYLAIFVQTKNKGQYTDVVNQTIEKNGSAEGAQELTKNKNVLQEVADKIMVIGFAIGGLFVANKLSITGAGAAMGMMQRAGKATGKWVGRRTKEVATKPLRSERIRNLGQSMQKSGFIGTRWAGRLLQNATVASGSNLVKDAEKRLAGKTDRQLADNMSTYTATERIAALKKLREHRNLDMVDNLEKYTNEDRFNQYGEAGSWKKIKIGSVGAPTRIAAAKAGDMRALDAASVAFIDEAKKQDIPEMQLSDMFKFVDGKEAFGMGAATLETYAERFVKAIVTRERGELLASTMNQLSSKQLAKFIRMTEDAITAGGAAVSTEFKDDFDAAKKSNKVFVATATTAAGGTTPPPPPPAGGPGHP